MGFDEGNGFFSVAPGDTNPIGHVVVNARGVFVKVGNQTPFGVSVAYLKAVRFYNDQVRGTASIIAAVKKSGVTRLLWVGGAGGLEVSAGVRVVDQPDMPDLSLVDYAMASQAPAVRPTFSPRDLV